VINFRCPGSAIEGKGSHESALVVAPTARLAPGGKLSCRPCLFQRLISLPAPQL
jgi:hypothetical protein